MTMTAMLSASQGTAPPSSTRPGRSAGPKVRFGRHSATLSAKEANLTGFPAVLQTLVATVPPNTRAARVAGGSPLEPNTPGTDGPVASRAVVTQPTVGGAVPPNVGQNPIGASFTTEVKVDDKHSTATSKPGLAPGAVVTQPTVGGAVPPNVEQNPIGASFATEVKVDDRHSTATSKPGLAPGTVVTQPTVGSAVPPNVEQNPIGASFATEVKVDVKHSTATSKPGLPQPLQSGGRAAELPVQPVDLSSAPAPNHGHPGQVSPPTAPNRILASDASKPVDPMNLVSTVRSLASADDSASSSLLAGVFARTTPLSAARSAGPSSAAASDAPRQVAEAVGQAGWPRMSGSVVVQLNPPSLGRVTVRISTGADLQVRVHLRVEHTTVRDALASDWGQVDLALRRHGLTPDSVAIDVATPTSLGQSATDPEHGARQQRDGAPAQPGGDRGDVEATSGVAPGEPSSESSGLAGTTTGRLLDYRM